MKKGKETTKGITLIALVITIIVLIILAGITIASITGENSIIKEARTAKELSEKAALEELVDLAIIKAEEKYNNPTLDQVIEEIKNKKVISNSDQVDRETGAIRTDAGYLIEGKLDDYIGKTSTGDGNTTGGGNTTGDGNTTGGGNTTGDGNTTGGGSTTTPTKTQVGELTAGEYVNYIDANGTTRKCVVLYDSTSSYGIQIITAESVEEVVLGTGGTLSTSSTDWSKAMSAYNVAINTLNTKARAYLNTTYATSARCVGSVPNSPNTEATAMFTTSYSYMSSYNGKLKKSDTNYTKDLEQMKKLEIEKMFSSCMMASRYISSDSSSTSFSLAYPRSNGGIGGIGIVVLQSNGVIQAWPGKGGLYPVITLQSTLKITGGAGTSENPYNLGV